MRTGLIATALVALASTGPAMAQIPAQMPELGAPKPFKLPAAETFTLPNGLRVTLLPYGISPKSTVVLRLGAGARNDAGQTWISAVTSDMLREGAGGRSSTDIARAAANMGGGLGAGSSMQATTLSIAVLSEHATDAVALLGDVAIRPTLPASELPRIKANLQRQLTVALSQPGSLAEIALRRAYYGDHPYGRPIPTAEQLASYTIDDVKRFHATQFGAKQAQLYIAGRFDAAAVKAAITRSFVSWGAGPDPLALPPTPKPGPRVLLLDRPNAPQSTIRIAFPAQRAGAPGDIAQRVENSLLGGAFNSRITNNIRENKGYTYSPGSGLSFEPDDARWQFSADVTTAVTGASLKEVFGEIRKMQDAPPTEEEAMGSRRYMAGTFVLQNSTATAVLGTLATRDLLGLPGDWLENYVPAVMAVTPQQFSDAARANHPLDKALIVVVGDLKTVEAQLKALPELANIPFERVAVP